MLKDPPFGYLAVKPPSPPTGSLRSADATLARLARRVAVLFGVDVPDNPTGRTWLGAYSSLTIADIARGAPASAESLSDDLDVLATATVSRYGPDTKAALVLAGADELFDSLNPVFLDTLRAFDTSNDGRRLADVSRVAVWACLVREAFKQQPALFAAAAHARAIQATALSPWKVHLSTIPEIDRSPIEVAKEASEPGPHSPDSLRFLDSSMQTQVTPDLRTGRPADSETDNPAMLRTTVDRLLSYLITSPERGAAWAVDGGDGRHSADAYFPVSILNTFVGEILAQSPLVTPLREDFADPGPALPYDWEPSDPDKPSKADKRTSACIRARMRPRLLSLAELKGLEVRSQRAVIHTHMHVLSILRNQRELSNPNLKLECRRDAQQVVFLATQLFGEDDALSRYIRLRHQSMELEDLRHSDSAGSSYLDAALGFFSDFAAMHAQWARRDGTVPDSVWIETVSALSPEYRRAAEIVRIHDPARGRDEYDTLRGYWEAMLEGRDYLGMPVTGGSVTAVVDSLIHHALLHNYAGLLINSYRRPDRMQGVEIAYARVLPLRRKVSAIRKSEVAHRISLQVLLRGIGRLAIGAKGKSRGRLEAIARELLPELEMTSPTNAIEQRPKGTISELNFATAFAYGALVVFEADAREGRPDAAQLGRIRTVVEWGRQALRRHQDVQGEGRSKSPEAKELKGLTSRIDRLMSAYGR